MRLKYKLAAVASIIEIGLVIFLLVVNTNPLSTVKSTSWTTYNVNTGTTTAPPTWGTNWRGNTGTIALTYDSSGDLWVRIQWTENGIIGDYTLWYSTDNTTYNRWTVTYGSVAYEITWQINVDWSTWTRLQVRSTTDTVLTGSPQRPSPAGEI
jgi:hypothetical protein